MEGKCNAFLIADRVIQENNGKIGIIGSFNQLNFPMFPAPCPPFMIYANLEDFKGTQEFSVNIIKDGSDLVVLSLGGEISFKDDGNEANLILPVLNLTIPKDGLYRMIITLSGYQFASRKITVKRIELPRQGGIQ